MSTTGPERRFDLGSVPWSRQGSFMTLSTLVRVSDHPGLDLAMPPGVYLHDLSGRRFWGHNAVFRGRATTSPTAPAEVSSRTCP